MSIKSNALSQKHACNYKQHTQTLRECLYVYILSLFAHRKMYKPTTGAVEARTNQYIAPQSTNTAPRSTRTAPANRQPNKQNIELEPYEQIYDEMN